MIAVNFPPHDFKIKEENSRRYIFDAIRKTWLVLTEEEWVRQNFVNFLIRELHYPATLIAIEKEIYLGELKKRFDILVYDKGFQPWMLVECKAPGILLNESVINQVLRYNISVPVLFIVITNGIGTMAWQKINNELKLLNEMPVWS